MNFLQTIEQALKKLTFGTLCSYRNNNISIAFFFPFVYLLLYQICIKYHDLKSDSSIFL